MIFKSYHPYFSDHHHQRPGQKRYEDICRSPPHTQHSDTDIPESELKVHFSITGLVSEDFRENQTHFKDVMLQEFARVISKKSLKFATIDYDMPKNELKFGFLYDYEAFMVFEQLSKV